MSLLVIFLYLALAAFGMPLAFSLGVSALGGLVLSGFDLSILPPRIMNSVNSFPLMSIPLFMVTGELMLKAGIMDRLVSFANAFVGRVKELSSNLVYGFKSNVLLVFLGFANAILEFHSLDNVRQ